MSGGYTSLSVVVSFVITWSLLGSAIFASDPSPAINAAVSLDVAGAKTSPYDVVPIDHWVYEAVYQLEAHGVLHTHFGAPGCKPRSRIEFAWAVADVAFAIVKKGTSDAQALPPSTDNFDLAGLEKLLGEFKVELVGLGVDLEADKRGMRALLKSYQSRTKEGPFLKIGPATLTPITITPVNTPAPPIDANWGDVCASGRIVGGGGEPYVGVEWDNPFYISKIILRLPEGFRVFDSSKLEVQYWRLDRPVRSISFAAPGADLAPAEQRCYAGEWQDAYTNIDFRLGSSQTPKSPPFDDVPTDHWAYRAINLLVDHGIMQGYPRGTICCKPAMTRFEFAQAFARAWLKVEKGAKPNADENEKVTVARSDAEALVELFDEFEDILKQMDVDTNATRLQLAELWQPFGDREDVLSMEASPLDAWMLSFPCPGTASNGVKKVHCSLLTTKLQVTFPDVVPYGTEISVIGHSYPLQ